MTSTLPPALGDIVLYEFLDGGGDWQWCVGEVTGFLVEAPSGAGTAAAAIAARKADEALEQQANFEGEMDDGTAADTTAASPPPQAAPPPSLPSLRLGALPATHQASMSCESPSSSICLNEDDNHASSGSFLVPQASPRLARGDHNNHLSLVAAPPIAAVAASPAAAVPMPTITTTTTKKKTFTTNVDGSKLNARVLEVESWLPVDWLALRDCQRRLRAAERKVPSETLRHMLSHTRSQQPHPQSSTATTLEDPRRMSAAAALEAMDASCLLSALSCSAFAPALEHEHDVMRQRHRGRYVFDEDEGLIRDRAAEEAAEMEQCEAEEGAYRRRLGSAGAAPRHWCRPGKCAARVKERIMHFTETAAAAAAASPPGNGLSSDGAAPAPHSHVTKAANGSKKAVGFATASLPNNGQPTATAATLDISSDDDDEDEEGLCDASGRPVTYDTLGGGSVVGSCQDARVVSQFLVPAATVLAVLRPQDVEGPLPLQPSHPGAESIATTSLLGARGRHVYLADAVIEAILAATLVPVLPAIAQHAPLTSGPQEHHTPTRLPMPPLAFSPQSDGPAAPIVIVDSEDTSRQQASAPHEDVEHNHLQELQAEIMETTTAVYDADAEAAEAAAATKISSFEAELVAAVAAADAARAEIEVLKERCEVEQRGRRFAEEQLEVLDACVQEAQAGSSVAEDRFVGLVKKLAAAQKEGAEAAQYVQVLEGRCEEEENKTAAVSAQLAEVQAALAVAEAKVAEAAAADWEGRWRSEHERSQKLEARLRVMLVEKTSAEGRAEALSESVETLQAEMAALRRRILLLVDDENERLAAEGDAMASSHLSNGPSSAPRSVSPHRQQSHHVNPYVYYSPHLRAAARSAAAAHPSADDEVILSVEDVSSSRASAVPTTTTTAGAATVAAALPGLNADVLESAESTLSLTSGGSSANPTVTTPPASGSAAAPAPTAASGLTKPPTPTQVSSREEKESAAPRKQASWRILSTLKDLIGGGGEKAANIQKTTTRNKMRSTSEDPHAYDPQDVAAGSPTGSLGRRSSPGSHHQLVPVREGDWSAYHKDLQRVTGWDNTSGGATLREEGSSPVVEEEVSKEEQEQQPVRSQRKPRTKRRKGLPDFREIEAEVAAVESSSPTIATESQSSSPVTLEEGLPVVAAERRYSSLRLRLSALSDTNTNTSSNNKDDGDVVPLVTSRGGPPPHYYASIPSRADATAPQQPPPASVTQERHPSSAAPSTAAERRVSSASNGGGGFVGFAAVRGQRYDDLHRGLQYRLHLTAKYARLLAEALVTAAEASAAAAAAAAAASVVEMAISHNTNVIDTNSPSISFNAAGGVASEATATAAAASRRGGRHHRNGSAKSATSNTTTTTTTHASKPRTRISIDRQWLMAHTQALFANTSAVGATTTNSGGEGQHQQQQEEQRTETEVDVAALVEALIDEVKGFGGRCEEVIALYEETDAENGVLRSAVDRLASEAAAA